MTVERERTFLSQNGDAAAPHPTAKTSEKATRRILLVRLGHEAEAEHVGPDGESRAFLAVDGTQRVAADIVSRPGPRPDLAGYSRRRRRLVDGRRSRCPTALGSHKDEVPVATWSPDRR